MRRGLGWRFWAIVRVNLRAHGEGADAAFSRWLAAQPEVQSAFTVSGDADFVLDVRLRDLDAFSRFVHDRLLVQPQVGQVRSDFILRTLKDSAAVDLSLV